MSEADEVAETTGPTTVAPTEDPARYRRVLEGLTGIPATDGNQVDILRNGDEIFPAMLEGIRSATTSVDLLTYSWWRGQITHAFADALAERARAGVRVRLMVDSLGGRHLGRALADQMRRAGVLVHFFRPYATYKLWNLNLRTHRRALVCDQEVAFTGGVGIAQQWTGDARTAEEWRETHYRVRGPAVDGIHAAFLSNWLQTPYELLDDRDRFPDRSPVGDMPVQTIRAASEPGWNDLALTMHGMLSLAVERVRGNADRRPCRQQNAPPERGVHVVSCRLLRVTGTARRCRQVRAPGRRSPVGPSAPR